jgi:acyl carrier protein
VSDKLVATVAEVLQVSPGLVQESTSMENTPEWDSLRHFTLILAVEEAFDVHFSSDDIPSLTGVAALRAELLRQGRDPGASG